MRNTATATTTPTPVPQKKGGMTPEGRNKLSLAAKARHAAKRGEGAGALQPGAPPPTITDQLRNLIVTARGLTREQLQQQVNAYATPDSNTIGSQADQHVIKELLSALENAGGSNTRTMTA